MPEKKILTADQQQLVNELIQIHGLDASQISFENGEITPIFDYEALSMLSLKLTDIQDIDVAIVSVSQNSVTARCIVTLPDGRTRRIEESAYLDETLHDGSKIDSFKLAEQIAIARATRRGIRSVGVNLFHAHKKFMETGEIAAGHLNNDPRYADYQEIKTIVGKLGWSDEVYRQFIADNFDGKSSQTELNDIELQKFKIMLRSLKRIEDSKQIAEPKRAA